MLVQLSGVPGSGKSTLARALAEARAMVVLNTDVVKNALLGSEIPMHLAGPATYGAALALAADLLEQGRDVVIDSPCRYRELLEGGLDLAVAASVPYGFIELRTDDPSILLERLDRRKPMVSQVASARDPVQGTAWEFGTPAATVVQIKIPEDTTPGWQQVEITSTAAVATLPSSVLVTAPQTAPTPSQIDGAPV